MTINVELLTKTLAHIEAHPELWDQEVFRSERACGTAYCFAGWAAVLSGAEFYTGPAYYRHLGTILPPGATKDRDIVDYTTELLGLEVDEDDDDPMPELFYSRNTLPDLRRIVGELIAGAGDRQGAGQ